MHLRKWNQRRWSTESYMQSTQLSSIDSTRFVWFHRILSSRASKHRTNASTKSWSKHKTKTFNKSKRFILHLSHSRTDSISSYYFFVMAHTEKKRTKFLCEKWKIKKKIAITKSVHSWLIAFVVFFSCSCVHTKYVDVDFIAFLEIHKCND